MFFPMILLGFGQGFSMSPMTNLGIYAAAQEKVEEAYKNASHAKAGSITAKANLVRDFEERNKKK